MKKKTEQQIEAYWNSCNDIVDTFVKKYLDDTDWYWVADEVGCVLSVGDCFLNMDTMIYALVLDVSPDDFHEWYWETVESDNRRRMNLKNWIKLRK